MIELTHPVRDNVNDEIRPGDNFYLNPDHVMIVRKHDVRGMAKITLSNGEIILAFQNADTVAVMIKDARS